jgi:hypothetical protein
MRPTVNQERRIDRFQDTAPCDDNRPPPPKTDPSAMRVPTSPGWAPETLDETDTTHP